MRFHGSTLLVLTFVAGTGTGIVLSLAKVSGPSTPPKEDAAQAHEPKLTRRAPVRRTAELNDAEVNPEPSSTQKPREELAHLQNDEPSALAGRSAADVLMELERAYQNRAREREARPIVVLRETSDEEEAHRPATVPEPTYTEETERVVAVVPTEPDLAGADGILDSEGERPIVVAVQNGDHFEQNTQNVVIVQNISPVFYGGWSAPTAVSSTNTSPSSVPGGRAWSSSLPSRTNPWAPVDYSNHHNPYSTALSGRPTTLPPSTPSGLTLIYRR